MRKIIIYIIIFSVITIFYNCKSTKYVEVPITNTSTSYNKMQNFDSVFIKDSIWIHDSIYIKEKGDTVFQYTFKDKLVYKNIYQDKWNTDTIFKTDTITKPITIKIREEVEVNKIYWWQKTLIYIGVFSIAALILTIYLKLKKK